MISAFKYFQDTRLIFGAGTVEGLGEIASEFGKNCLLVSTKINGNRSAVYDRILNILSKSNLNVLHFDGVHPNPTTSDISCGAEAARSINADVIIGFGGGSSMDAAKAIAVEASHEGSSWDYLFYKKQPTAATLPVIAVSTTSGTGSHVTQVSVVTNESERNKSALYNDLLFPRVAIVDPELMVTMPSHITAATGFDVFCHAFESLLHPNCGVYIEMLAREAIKIVAKHLPRVFKDPEDLASRSAMAWADTLAGFSIANAGVTLPHGMGMAIGGMYPNVSHGQALAIVYPACTEFTWQYSLEQHAFLSLAFNEDLKGLSESELAGNAPSEVTRFLSELQLNKQLSDVDVPLSELDLLASQCMVLPDYKNNPRVATRDEITELINLSF